MTVSAPPRPRTLVSAPAPGCRVIAVHGAVGLLEARRLERTVVDELLGGGRLFVLDLRGVTQVRAGLVGTVLRMLRGLGAVGGRLALVLGPEGSAAGAVGSDEVRALVAVAETPEEAVVLLRGRG